MTVIAASLAEKRLLYMNIWITNRLVPSLYSCFCDVSIVSLESDAGLPLPTVQSESQAWVEMGKHGWLCELAWVPCLPDTARTPLTLSTWLLYCAPLLLCSPVVWSVRCPDMYSCVLHASQYLLGQDGWPAQRWPPLGSGRGC